MPWRETLVPVPMTRIAVVAPEAGLRDALIRVAGVGVVQLDQMVPDADLAPDPAARALARLGPTGDVQPRLSAAAPDLDQLVAAGRADLLTGEVHLGRRAAQAVRDADVAALVGWAPTDALPALAERLAPVGAAVAPLARPRGVEPPTASRAGGAREAFAPLVRAYGTSPYADVDTTVLAGLAYVVMFGAMFGDVGHGALLAVAGLLLRAGRPRRLSALRRHWLFVAAAGLASMGFGLLYGECFGPTGVVPVLWLAPMEEPLTLLLAAVGLGAVLLAGAYAVGTVNRFREGGWRLALYAPSGVAGSLLFLAAGVAVAAWYLSRPWLAVMAGVAALVGLGLAYAGLAARAGGGAGLFQAAIELFDTVVRLGTNAVSFARLAAFGLTHAVLGWIVWQATTGLGAAGSGAGAVAAVAGAVLVFVVGNALAFALEGLVAAVQALRLEYYELFSRVFLEQGRPFQPWRITVEEESCPHG